MRSNYINELEDFYEIGSFKGSNANAAVLKDKEHVPHESDEACPLPDDGIAEDTAPAVGDKQAYMRHNPRPSWERRKPNPLVHQMDNPDSLESYDALPQDPPPLEPPPPEPPLSE